MSKAAIGVVSIVIGIAGTGAALAQERHRFPISIANPAPSDAVRDGPIFQKVDTIISAMTRKDGQSFGSFLTPDAKLILDPKRVDVKGSDEIGAVIQIIVRNCQGPYSIDEGQTWAQTSWVCHVGKNEPVREYFSFQHSPEIAVEFRSDGAKVKQISAMDLIPIPLHPLFLPMDAAEHVPDKR